MNPEFSGPEDTQPTLPTSGSSVSNNKQPSSPAVIGTVLGGRYELLSTIASGGMAQVWRAKDKILNRPVAVKVLHPHLATDDGFVTRFRREAVASARLSHTSIVAVYDTISESGIEAIVMELIDGKTLRQLLDETPILSPERIVNLGTQIADALNTAHRAGIVHRDIKPANIMINPDQRVIVTDFGIAKATKDADLTHTGTLLGTAKYLAPEQVEGHPIDPRADIYSLGVVLFEAATGQAPFDAETDAATALARLRGDVPRCRERSGDVPPDLDAVIAKAMARNPDERYERAVEIKAALLAADLTQVAIAPAAPAATVADPPAPSAVPISPPSATPKASDGTSIMSTDMVPVPTSEHKMKSRAGKERRRDKRSQQNRRGQDQRPKVAPESKVEPTRSRAWFGRTALALLITAGIVVAGLLAMGGGLPDLGGSASSGNSPVVANVRTYDPQVDGVEWEENIGRIFDEGASSRGWYSKTYGGVGFGGTKTGVGFIVEFEEAAKVDSLEFQTKTENWSADFYITDETDLEQAEPSDYASLVASVSDVSGPTTVTDISNRDGKFLIVWFTEPGVTVDADGKLRNRIQVDELIIK